MTNDSKGHDKEPQIVIIKKKIIKKEAHHGGSWKIAYADFVTAMMAFFLLMWLLSMLNKYQLAGISNYFNKPLKNVFVDTNKNDSKTPKVPDEDTKKYKLQLISQEKVQLDARSRGDSLKNSSDDGKQPEQRKDPGKGPAGDKPQATEKSSALEQAKQIQQQAKQEKAKHDATMKQLATLKAKMEQDLNNDKSVSQYKQQVNFTIVKDGLKITLHDLQNKPMFSLGKTDFEEYAKPLLQWLTKEMNQSKRKATIIGYTDTNQYMGDSYSNWELSADRATATRRVLIKYGMKGDNIIRVQGAGDLVLLDKKDGQDAKNRRIDIILLTDEAVQRLMDN